MKCTYLKVLYHCIRRAILNEVQFINPSLNLKISNKKGADTIEGTGKTYKSRYSSLLHYFTSCRRIK